MTEIEDQPPIIKEKTPEKLKNQKSGVLGWMEMREEKIKRKLEKEEEERKRKEVEEKKKTELMNMVERFNNL